MKTILKYLLYLLFFLSMIVVFLPKENLYFLAQNELKKNNIELKEKLFDSKLNGVEIENLDILFNKLLISNIDNISISTYLVSSEISVNAIILQKSLNSYAPKLIDSINIKHTLLDPTNIMINGSFKDGKLNGKIDLLERVVTLNLEVSKNFTKKYRQLLRYFKKQKQENNTQTHRYSYEYRF